MNLVRGLWNNAFVRNLMAMGSAQLAIRVSRLATTVILSRLLNSEAYGLAAIALTVYEFIAVFTRNGINARVVQATDDELESVTRTAYVLTWVICGGLVVIQALLALPIAWLYHDPRLFAPIALMSVIYLATPLCAMQGALQQREGRLGRIAFAGALQVITDNILTAIFALLGMGMWAIVLPKILVAPIWIIVVRYGHTWRPAKLPLRLSAYDNWREITRFSRNIVGVEIMTTFQANVDNIMVGAFLGVRALGVYYFAFNAGLGITIGLISALAQAVFPHLCQARGDPAMLSLRYREAVTKLGLVVTPLVILQAALAPVYVPLVFGQKWNVAIPILSIICLSALARPFAAVTSQLLTAVGRPDIELRWQAALTVVLGLALLVATHMNLLSVALAVLAVQTTMLGGFFVLAPRPFLERRPHGLAARRWLMFNAQDALAQPPKTPKAW
jgi:PST family polysaccharide transporter